MFRNPIGIQTRTVFDRLVGFPLINFCAVFGAISPTTNVHDITAEWPQEHGKQRLLSTG